MSAPPATHVTIIPTGGANIASLEFALRRLQVECTVSDDERRIRAASHVILPGVGAAGDAMRRLRASGLAQVIPTLRQPVLGICLGMQLLFDSSDENQTRCLGLIPGNAARFDAAAGRPVPHMGWNTVQAHGNSPLLAHLDSAATYAYFVHSYAIGLSEFTTARTEYGLHFSACAQRDNFHGVQFHPERSAKVGAQVLRNFLAQRSPCD